MLRDGSVVLPSLIMYYGRNALFRFSGRGDEGRNVQVVKRSMPRPFAPIPRPSPSQRERGERLGICGGKNCDKR